MRFVIKGPLKNSIFNLMRELGYHFLGENEDEGVKEFNFVHQLGRDSYPRFHVFLKNNKGDLFLNLHLDQRKTVYKGARAHANEKEGELVEDETKRIKNYFK
ncbi:MAG: hypothetical protein NTZ84_02150 [Candidatus Nealsonbacteria bacterium]|nr:hypothetical protein [Candidatus Nealsonbacteria bacterium]